LIDIGDLIVLEREDSDADEKFRCKLLDKKGDRLFVDYPVNQASDKIEFFPNGTKFKASFISKDNFVYLFETTISGRKREKNIPMLELVFPGEKSLSKIQRREFVRIDTAIDAAIHPVKGEFHPFTAITSDISAGGVAIVLPERHELRAKMIVNGWFVLPLASGRFEYLKTRCQVTRVISGENNREKAPLQFIDLKEKERQLVMRLCFERQLAIRKRGMS
jgi:c-di-GMP-binding flagellar brake protein YcgR